MRQFIKRIEKAKAAALSDVEEYVELLYDSGHIESIPVCTVLSRSISSHLSDCNTKPVRIIGDKYELLNAILESVIAASDPEPILLPPSRSPSPLELELQHNRELEASRTSIHG